jgi:hypothetical protein
MFGFKRKPAQDVLDHSWTLVRNFQTSTQEFYSAVERELIARQVPDLDISRVEFSEGGLLSAKRQYLRLTRDRLIFDICAAPFGTSYFFSWRIAELPPRVRLWELLVALIGMFTGWAVFVQLLGFFRGTFFMLVGAGFTIWFLRNTVSLGLQEFDAELPNIPVIGPIYERFFRKETYYRQDTRLMYLATVPDVVKGHIEQITAAKGITLLKYHERKPILGELYRPTTTPLEPKPSVPEKEKEPETPAELAA